jgi:putative ABC transport system substrate-binding protein
MTLGSALAFPQLALSQPSGRTYRLGWLSSGAQRTESYNVAFVDRLRELGFIEGRNLVIEFRSVAGRHERCPRWLPISSGRTATC